MNNFSSLIENSKRAVRYWWLLLIIGIALFVVGILIFVYPTQSYLGMSLVFGWLMLFSGILEVVLSSANKHFITGRGWMLAGGIIEIILGIILIFNVALSAATLPIFLGFWLMLRGFSAIGLGGDMNAMETGRSFYRRYCFDGLQYAGGFRYHRSRPVLCCHWFRNQADQEPLVHRGYEQPRVYGRPFGGKVKRLLKVKK